MVCKSCRHGTVVTRSVVIDGCDRSAKECVACRYIEITTDSKDSSKIRIDRDVWTSELRKSSMAQDALRILGLPEPSNSKFYEACDSMRILLDDAERLKKRAAIADKLGEALMDFNAYYKED